MVQKSLQFLNSCKEVLATQLGVFEPKSLVGRSLNLAEMISVLSHRLKAVCLKHGAQTPPHLHLLRAVLSRLLEMLPPALKP